MAWTDYQFRAFRSAYIERGRDTPLALETYEAGALSAPSSGTFTLVSPDGTAVIDGIAVTIASSKATYTVPTATMGAYSLGTGWLIRWELVMGDGNTHEFRQDASLVRARLHSVISDVDLTARHSDLLSYLPDGTTTLEGYILEALWTMLGRLEAAGRRPYLVLSPSALRPWQQALALSLVCRDFAGDGREDNKWARLADHYDGHAEVEWSRLSLVYDEDDDAVNDSTARVGKASLWLAGRSNV